MTACLPTNGFTSSSAKVGIIPETTKFFVGKNKIFDKKRVRCSLLLFSEVDAVVLLHFAHDEGAFYGAQVLYLAQFVEHKLLVLLHVARANL